MSAAGMQRDLAKTKATPKMRATPGALSMVQPKNRKQRRALAAMRRRCGV